MEINSNNYRGIRRILFFLFLFTINIYAQIEFSNLDINSNVSKKMSKSSVILSKSGSKGISLGDYVWFDHNLNGIQDRGEVGLANVKIKLFNTPDCSGTSIQERITSNLGYYEFDNLSPTIDEYCISVDYPNYWTATKAKQGDANFDSNVIESVNGVGKIKNVFVSYTDNSLDIGLHHKDKNCQSLSLELGAIGKFGYDNSWGVKPWLEVEFNNFVAHGFCNEYHNGGPKVGDKYVVHYKDRLGFTELQHDKLSRAFRFASDPEVMALFEKRFSKTESYYWIEIFHNIFIWYSTDWNYSLEKVDNFIDENSWFKNLTVKDKATLKEVAHLIVNKIEGTNGKTQYQPMKVYYLWNESSDKRQDAIVPETFLIPNLKACSGDSDPLLKVKLGDRVWLDSNKNGKQDSKEVGLQGIKVELYDTNGKLISSTLTNKQGYYAFTDLDAGEYSVKFIKKAGYLFTTKMATGVSSSLNSDADISTGITDSFFLDSDTLDIDAGMYVTPQPSIDIVKTTNGGNVSNIIVGDTITWSYLVKNSGNTIINTIKVTDDKEGLVACGNDTLNPSQSMTCTKVGVAILGAYKNIGKVEGLAPNGHKVNSTDESSYIGHEAPVQLATVGDYVWLDSNQNGLQDIGELPLSKVVVQLFDEHNKAIKSIETDSSGKYEFKDVPAAKYYIKFTVPNAYSVTKKSQGSDKTKDSDANSNGKTALFTLVGGQDKNDIDLGVYPTVANLGDRVWLDINKNGKQDNNEVGVEGIKVELYDKEKKLLSSTVTNKQGFYGFNKLAIGEYSVKFIKKVGYSFTAKNATGVSSSLNSDADVSTGMTDTISLEKENLDIDAGIYVTSQSRLDIVKTTNGGDVSNIIAGDSITWSYLIKNSGNTTIKNIKLTDDKEGAVTCPNATLEPKKSMTCTKVGVAILGSYKNVGTVEGLDSNGHKVTSTDESSYIGHEAPVQLATVGNYVWLDKNKNGIQEVGELPLSKVVVKLFNKDNKLIKSIETNSSGEYKFKDIPVGKYYVKFTIPNGYTVTKKSQGNDNSKDSDANSNGKTALFSLVAGQKRNDIDFGIYPTVANLGDRVWLDSNKNGKQDSNEVGLQSIKVELYNTNGKLLSSTVTNKEGFYAFGNLDVGEYSVKFIKKTGYSFTKKRVTGVDSSLDSDADISTGMTEIILLDKKNLDIDAGMYITPQPRLDMVKTTNGGDVSNIIVGDSITWSYIVKNSGNTIINNIKVVDDKEGAVACNSDTLNPTQSMTCTKVGVAILGAYKNVGKVEGVDPNGHKVTSTDESSYVGHEAPVQLGTIGNYVWLDSNRNGIQDVGELPLSKVVIQLFNEHNKLIKSTQTNSSGNYEFKDVPTGKYYVKFSVPSSYSVTKQSQGNDNTKDSDANSNGKTALFELLSGQNRDDIDIGFYPKLANLGDKVWFDTNANGIQDSNEKRGIVGVIIKLYSEENKLIATTKTTSRGEYIFRNLTPKNYYVEFEVPNNYKVSPKKQGSNQSSDSNANKNGKTDIFTLYAGRDDKTIDMGLYQESTKIGDRVFYDLNKNGIQDSGENGVDDVTVKLFEADSGKLIKTTKTSAFGIYLFENVVAGKYYIKFIAPAGYTITDAHKGTKENDSNPDKSGRTENFTVSAGTQDSTIDMGIYQNVVSYGDRVFLDTNHNGLQDIGEKGVKNVKVTIFSANSNFKKSMLTDESGNYLFTHLSAGEYFAEFSDIPYGYLITKKDVNDNSNDLNDSDGFEKDGKILTEVALLTPGVNDLSWDLGIYKTVCLPGKAVLGNLVWEDLNKDGIQDIGEHGIANVRVILYNNDTDEKVATTLTDENGLYEFPNIDPDFNYYVQFKVPSGYVVSPEDQEVDSIDSDADATGKTDVISLSPNQINSSIDMGLYHKGATIGDKVFFDELNGVSNGIQDVGEQGVVDVKVTLYNAQGSVVKTTQTNANGEYHFTNVYKGNYTVGFSELPDGYIFTLKDKGNDEERDSDVKPNGRTDIIVINGTEIITSVDAGLKKVKMGISSNDKRRGQTGKNVTVDVLANDIEGSYSFDPKTVKITSTPDGATLSEDGKKLTVPNEGIWSVNIETGAITFTPKDGFTGDPTAISYSVQDIQGNESFADVEVDYPPLAKDDRVNAEVGKQIVIFVLENDAPTSTPLDKASLRLIEPVTGDEVESIIIQGEGTWSTNIDGSITFTPEDGFKNNPTPVKYVVREISGDVSNQATITIVYPDAVDDIVMIPANHVGSTTVNVAENDSNNTIANTVTIGCQKAGVQTLVIDNEGRWSVADNGSITFTPINRFNGDPTDIQYTIGLVSGERSNCANIDLRHELLAVDDTATLNVGGVSLINVLDNDSGALNIASVRLVIPSNRVEEITLSADGRTLTVPNEGVWNVNDEGVITFTAIDGFTSSPTPIGYSVENIEGIRSNIAQVLLTEGGVTITANDDNGTANGGEPVILNVLDNDQGDINSSSVRFIDVNGDEVTTLVVVGEGTWSVDNSGVVTFTGETGFVGTPTPVRYIVHGNVAVLSDTATIRITGTCDCTPYESSIPAMGQLAGVFMVLLTMLLSMLFLRKEELYLIK